MLGNTTVQLFVSVLRLVLRLGGLRAIHQTFAEVPSSLRELWGIHDHVTAHELMRWLIGH